MAMDRQEFEAASEELNKFRKNRVLFHAGSVFNWLGLSRHNQRGDNGALVTMFRWQDEKEAIILKRDELVSLRDTINLILDEKPQES